MVVLLPLLLYFNSNSASSTKTRRPTTMMMILLLHVEENESNATSMLCAVCSKQPPPTEATTQEFISYFVGLSQVATAQQRRSMTWSTCLVGLGGIYPCSRWTISRLGHRTDGSPPHMYWVLRGPGTSTRYLVL